MRVLFTVALTVAVAAVVFPAVDAASVDRADSQTGGAVDRLVGAGRTLASGNDAVPDRQAAARRAVSLSLPVEGVASVPLVSLTVGPPRSDTSTPRRATDGGTPEATRITWRVAGGQRHVRQVDGLRLRSTDGGRFRLDEGGRHRLVLALLERDGNRVVTVAPEGSG